jgi:hypothetical protein
MRRIRRKIVPEHPKGEMDVKFKAFVERITWYSLGIIAIDADVSHEHRLRADAVGSGTACTWKGHSLILTAEHVIADTQPDRLAFLLRVDDALNWEGMGKPAKVVQRVPTLLSGTRSTTWLPSFSAQSCQPILECNFASFPSSSREVERLEVKGP